MLILKAWLIWASYSDMVIGPLNKEIVNNLLLNFSSTYSYLLTKSTYIQSISRIGEGVIDLCILTP